MEARESFWDRQQVVELEKREATYRERLALEHRMNERLRNCSEALQRVLRDRPPKETNLLETLHAIALLTAQTLEIRRASVWLIDSQRHYLRCRVLLVDGIEHPSDQLALPVADCPAYLRALRTEDPVAVSDVTTDPRTRELSDYLAEHGVGALLDIAVIARGEPIGVVCLEHLGGPRHFFPAEIAFASHLGSLVALGVEAERRVRAEYAATEAEARYRHLVESLPVVVYSLDADMQHLRYVSPSASDLGMSVDEWLKAGPNAWLERIVDEDRPAVLDRFRADLAHGFRPELVYRARLDGLGLRWIRDTCSLVRDAQGKPHSFQGLLSDITAQREAELAREESERRARALLNTMALLAVRLDCEGRVVDVNPYFTEITGFTHDEVVGTSWYDHLASREEAMRLQASHAAAQRVGSIAPRTEYAVRTKNGEARRLLWTRLVLKNLDGESQGLITLGMDLTDRLRLEAELTQQAKIESLGHLASAVAHDFNNLLTVILNQSALLARLATGDRVENAKASLDAALTQATELTQSLLVYARKNPEKKESTELDPLLQDLSPLIRAMAGKEVSLLINLRAPDGYVWIDRTRLRQLVLNLVGNAAQATAGHGTSVRLGTHLEFLDPTLAKLHNATDAGEFLVLTVEDDGRGMDAACMNKMFEPFFTTKGEGRGTGLGLAICQSIVRDAGGFIEVQSELGEGTRVDVYLPRKVAEEHIRCTPLSEVVRQPRVLLALDPVSAPELAATVRDAGYAVVYASELPEVMRCLSSSFLAVLVLDTELGPNASSIARGARAIHPDVRVIVLESATPLATDTPSDVVLKRPLNGPGLVEAIDGVLRGRSKDSHANWGRSQ